MKKFIIITIVVMSVTGCLNLKKANYFSYDNNIQIEYDGTIYLYGESHGDAKLIEKEFELWNEFYSVGMRHLFIEYPYYTAEYLNIWMRENNDRILNEIYSDWKGTAAYTPHTLNFYRKIKENCPETIFHGTDVGHQYDSIGYRFFKYLEKNDLKDTLEYELAKEVIEQGIEYYGPPKDHLYRENKMVENFVREIETVENECIMGIYGNAHVGINDYDYTSHKIPNMANQYV